MSKLRIAAVILVISILIGYFVFEQSRQTTYQEVVSEFIGEDEDLQPKSIELESNDVKSREALKDTFNLAMNVFHAMQTKNYDYLEEISSSAVSINKETNSMMFNHGSLQHEQPISADEVKLQNLHLNFYLLEDNTFTLSFLIIQNEMSVEVYFEFIKDGENWFLNDYKTN
ncbi:hypothetical protein [Caldalkalibacillus mannanilyticus]|uniref:hypothetical protein n=1 Tax=Caldalkalibacillus mannanilyticus TaxID=1418 RepID=UPI000468CB3D|nr:hypothetical protein [Caldalkalibacillus mannanilyticus]